ncbi:ATP-binding protein [Promicromonospora sukumoe]|uniref:ATP-binding protein n=1 Tax=Promicromonospora sukumoe TaxID=88382 RepID=UPI001C71BF1D|nr:ATP-binding protein [Promicromonospora sukumoe]
MNADMAPDTAPDSVFPELVESRRGSTTTLTGWREFVAGEPIRFDLLDQDTLAGLTPARRAVYDEQRVAYHSELIVVETSAVRNVIHQGRLLSLLNQREISARRSLIVSGPGATGKTTAIKMLGKTHETRTRLRHPGQERIPVVYITAPPKGSPLRLATEFANFLGLDFHTRANASKIAEAVCEVMVACRTDLIIVDEIHNLNLATRAGEDLSDHLKYFTEHLPATFVYAGIHVESSGLFTGIRGKQLSGRSVLLNTSPFPCAEEWTSLIAALEMSLRLHQHVPGTLIRQAKYLHQRTGGSISSLSQLVRQAAISAILLETEAVTRDLLDEMVIDHAAESAAPSRPRRKRSAGA